MVDGHHRRRHQQVGWWHQRWRRRQASDTVGREEGNKQSHISGVHYKAIKNKAIKRIMNLLRNKEFYRIESVQYDSSS
jgi:hypothetical protein